MEILIDSCDINALSKLNEIHLVDGVTTNPTVLLKGGADLDSAFKSISKIIKGTIHLQVSGKTSKEIIDEGKKIAKLSPNVVVKIPMSEAGLQACYALTKLKIKTNITLCFSPMQALIASRVGATYVSLFIGRVDDIGIDSLAVVEDCCRIWQNYPTIQSKLLIASIRNMMQVVKIATMGVDAVTIPPQVAIELAKHHLTDIGIAKFDSDYKQNKERIKK